RRRIVERANASMDKLKGNNTAVLKFRIVTMTEIIELTFDVPDIAKHPIHDVNKMAELCKKGSSIHRFGSLPSTRLVIAIIPVPVTVYLNHTDITDQLLVHHLFKPLRGWTVAVLFNDEYLPRHLQR